MFMANSLRFAVAAGNASSGRWPSRFAASSNGTVMLDGSLRRQLMEKSG